MEKVVDILMRRDNLTKQEAQNLISQVKNDISDAICSGDYDLVEDIMYSDLGLEMDYIDQLL